MRDSWKVLRLNEVCSEIIDCVNKTAPVVDEVTPYKMIRTTNVRNGRIDTDSVRYVTAETFKKWTRRTTPRRNDIILTREAPLGEIGLLRSDDNIFLGQRLIQYRANPVVMDQHYLYYAFQDGFMQGQIRGYGSGATVEHLRIGDCETIKVKVPPLPTQKKIASILTAYDDLIENNRQRIKILEEMAEEIYKEWFVRLRFPGYRDATFLDKEGKVVPHGTEGALPEGWERARLGDIIELAYGKSLPDREREKGKVPVYGSGGITGYHSSALVKAPGIIVGRKGTVGSTFFEHTDFFPIDTAFYVQTELPLEFVFLNFQFQNFISGDAAVPGLNRNQAYSNPFINPNRETLDQFTNIIRPIFKDSNILQQKNTLLQETRDLLLPRLMSGKLEV